MENGIEYSEAILHPLLLKLWSVSTLWQYLLYTFLYISIWNAVSLLIASTSSYHGSNAFSLIGHYSSLFWAWRSSTYSPHSYLRPNWALLILPVNCLPKKRLDLVPLSHGLLVQVHGTLHIQNQRPSSLCLPSCITTKVQMGTHLTQNWCQSVTPNLMTFILSLSRKVRQVGQVVRATIWGKH